MADGDASAGTAASVAGMAVMTGIEKVRYAWRFINSTRDLIAAHITSGTHAASAINSGTLAEARIPAITDASKIPNLNASKITSGTLDEARIPAITDASKIPNLNGSKITAGNIDVPGTVRSGGTLISLGGVNVVSTAVLQAVPGTGLSGWTSVVARNSDGTIGVAVSSRRFKKNIKTAPRRLALLSARVVTFLYHKKVDPAQTLQRGLIAEELHELGLTEYVVYDAEGAPFSIRYELLAVDLLQLVQDHETRLERLEKGAL